ncbi:AAA family ATPase [Blautia producta]|uniref:AAA family ATPase n=1 Tax=Blautia producta TaxID=33035 RepID=UPI0031B62A8E
MKLVDRLIRYIDAGFPILYINSFEENKIDENIMGSAAGRKLLEWNGANGFVDFRTKVSNTIMDNSLVGVLRFLLEAHELNQSVLVLKDIHTLLEDQEVLSLLKKIAQNISNGELDCSVLIEDSILKIPKELEPYITILETDYLSVTEIREIICEFIKENDVDMIQGELLDKMAIAFKGLSQFEIENILALAYSDDGELTKDDLQLIFEQKRQRIMKSNILEMIPLKENLDDIGGLENLKKWLEKKGKILKDVDRAKSFGVDVPKGVLIAGVPGCGKSLNAKAAAKLFEVPLLRLDMGRLMGKYVGESEANMREAISLAEAISPCVLWVDELEKAFAGIGGEGGGADVTTRLFGSLLTWMQEKESAVFVVATANDIIKLPPELLRKGRFDEIFYVGLPNEKEREKIFEIHIKKRRRQDFGRIDIKSLVSHTDGYSGADIEGVVKESVENAYAAGRNALTTSDILEVIKNTHSLSEIMKEPLKKMSEEYENRKFKNASVKE